MKALVLSLCLTPVAFGQEVKLDQTPVYVIEPLKQGQPAPFDGRLFDNQSYVLLAQRLKAAEAERDALRESPTKLNGTSAIVVAVLSLLALGGGVALGVQLKK